MKDVMGLIYTGENDIHLGELTSQRAVAALPIAAWEISLGVWLIAKGFSPDALAQLAHPEHAAASSGTGSNPADPPLVA